MLDTKSSLRNEVERNSQTIEGQGVASQKRCDTASGDRTANYLIRKDKACTIFGLTMIAFFIVVQPPWYVLLVCQTLFLAVRGSGLKRVVQSQFPIRYNDHLSIGTSILRRVLFDRIDGAARKNC